MAPRGQLNPSSPNQSQADALIVAASLLHTQVGFGLGWPLHVAPILWCQKRRDGGWDPKARENQNTDAPSPLAPRAWGLLFAEVSNALPLPLKQLYQAWSPP